MNPRLRLALSAAVACNGCAPSDPAPEPVGLQRAAQELVLVVPLCPGETVERVVIETTPDAGAGARSC